MYLDEITSGYSEPQRSELISLIREFLLYEIQLAIGNTSLRSWEEDEIAIARESAQKIALQLRSTPWGMSVDFLGEICDNAKELLSQLDT